ncbi:uncharacterized protein LOC133204703 [Saccostrea echinata]|uniref:uncharacterized protein LOC133204703 n=1 Tax=Saccostrea echinata TaxID=191078 RepID=UPI002A839249|nr:uncharacterized protein LOC133204703 [Saccostrea echinata]
MSVNEEMERTQGNNVNRDFYSSSKKPVYVLSDLYEDISSDEDEVIRMDQTPQNCDIGQSDFMQDLEIISVNTNDFEDRADELLDYCDIDDERMVVADSDKEEEIEEDQNSDGGRKVEFRDTDSDIASEDCIDNNNITKSTVCLLLNKTTRNYPDGTIEVSRDTHVVYFEDLTPSEIDYESVASEVLSEIPKHFEEGNIRFTSGDFSYL